MRFFKRMRSAACMTTVLAINICSFAEAEESIGVPVAEAISDSFDSTAPEALSVAPANTPEILNAAPAKEQATAPVQQGAVQLASEMIRERYPNRAIKISRQVIQDEAGNYVNHGPWQHMDPHGNLVAEGDYRFGKRDGLWSRQHMREDSPLLSAIPFNSFEAPMTSEATFQHGLLHGAWKILDAQDRVIVDWQFDNGERHGVQTWYYPNGSKMRTVGYTQGVVDGVVSLFDSEGDVIDEEVFHLGRKESISITHFKGTDQKQASGTYLLPLLVKAADDDWWNAVPAKFEAKGDKQKHGVWTYWHPNGQVSQEGKFVQDVPVGRFTWWYSNGQKGMEGEYIGGHQSGRWVWWHENGQKKIEGDYFAGMPDGPWSWWEENGTLARRADFSDQGSEVAVQPPKEKPRAAQRGVPRRRSKKR